MRKSHLGRAWAAVVVAILFVVAAASAYAASSSSAPKVKAKHSADVLRFDIVEDPTRFVFSEKPVDADGLPAYGNYFVTQGYLYPEGTLNGADGVLPDGKPAFPDKVLGEWTCYGTHLGKGAKTEKGPWVITTQLFSLGKNPGERTVVTDGYELPEVGVAIKRAITGGTGRYRSAEGEQVQRLLGFGSTNAIKLRVTLRVER